MKLFLPSLEVGLEEGFTTEKDIFGRKPIGDGLTNLVTSVDQPLVIALDAQWGSGKSTFLKMWAGDLRKAGIGVVHFDAFESDYLEDAFTAIAGQIISLAQEKHKEQDGRVIQFAHKAFGASKVVARSLLKLGLKIGTVGALEAEDLSSIAKEVGAEVSSVGDKYLGEALTKQKEQKAIIVEFREALAALPALLSPVPDGVEGQTKPLVIIIDELDRCRPSFALEVIERVKHFFAVPNVHFVLGVHLGQLENSVRASYGANIDGRMYLQKFISLPVMLVDARQDNGNYSPMKYSKWLASQYEMNDQDVEFIAPFIGNVAVAQHLSLRTIERIYSNVALTLAFSSEKVLRPNPIVAGLCILRVTHPELFVLAKTGDLRFGDVSAALGFDRIVNNYGKSRYEYISDMWQYCTDGNLDDDRLNRMEQQFSRYHISNRKWIISHVAGTVMDRFIPF